MANKIKIKTNSESGGISEKIGGALGAFSASIKSNSMITDTAKSCDASIRNKTVRILTTMDDTVSEFNRGVNMSKERINSKVEEFNQHIESKKVEFDELIEDVNNIQKAYKDNCDLEIEKNISKLNIPMNDGEKFIDGKSPRLVAYEHTLDKELRTKEKAIELEETRYRNDKKLKQQDYENSKKLKAQEKSAEFKSTLVKTGGYCVGGGMGLLTFVKLIKLVNQ